MNPFNLLINYVIANSRASFYNVSGNQEVTNTALIAGMVSDNPMISYLLIDNKAKAVSESTIPTVTVLPETINKPSIPETGTNPKDTKGTPTNESSEIVTFEVVTKQINAVKEEIFGEIAKLGKQLPSPESLKTLEDRLKASEDEGKRLSTAIGRIEQKLQIVSTENSTPDTAQVAKSTASSKSSSKPQ